MNISGFFGFFEDMVRSVHDEQGGFRPQAAFLGKGNDVSFLFIDLESRTDTPLLIRDMIRFNRYRAYGVAFEALKLGSPEEEEALDSGEVILDVIGNNNVRDLSAFLDMVPNDPEQPNAAMFLYMGSSSGACRTRAYEVTREGGKKKLGRRLEKLEAIASEYADLHRPAKRQASKQ